MVESGLLTVVVWLWVFKVSGERDQPGTANMVLRLR